MISKVTLTVWQILVSSWGVCSYITAILKKRVHKSIVSSKELELIPAELDCFFRMWQKRLVAFLSVFVCITPGIINALDCGGSFTEMSGDFHSPLQMVGENKCSWNIKVPNEYRIKLIFNSLLMVNTHMTILAKLDKEQ